MTFDRPEFNDALYNCGQIGDSTASYSDGNLRSRADALMPTCAFELVVNRLREVTQLRIRKVLFYQKKVGKIIHGTIFSQVPLGYGLPERYELLHSRKQRVDPRL